MAHLQIALLLDQLFSSMVSSLFQAALQAIITVREEYKMQTEQLDPV